MRDTPLPLTDHLCFALYSATQAMQATYKPLLEPLGLTYPQYLVMVALWGQDGLTVSGLGGQIGLESNTLTPLLKRMATAGLLTRSRDTGDERQVRLTLTEAGHALQARAAHLPAGILEKSGLTLDGLIDLQRRVMALRDHLRANA